MAPVCIYCKRELFIQASNNKSSDKVYKIQAHSTKITGEAYKSVDRLCRTQTRL